MSTVAQMFPALRQPDGSVWYRCGSERQAGWSTDPAQADPSYFAEGATEPITLGCVRGVSTATANDLDQLAAFTGQLVRQSDERPQPRREEPEPVELSADGTEGARFTETMQYPLPPEPPRYQATFRNHGYMLPHPDTGIPQRFTRATTIAKTCDDTYKLEKWTQRELVRYVLLFTRALPEHMWSDQEQDEIDARLAHITPQRQYGGKLRTRDEILELMYAGIEARDKQGLNDLFDVIVAACGGEASKELGTCIHAWLEALDLGMVRIEDMPQFVQPYALAYVEVLRRHGIIPVPEYVERLVFNDRGTETVVGMLDRIFRILATGDLVLGDVKTSESLEFSWLTYAVQLAAYGYAPRILDTDGKGWSPMPDLPLDYAVLMHVPRGNPEGTSIVTYDLYVGGKDLVLSQKVRAARNEAKKLVPYRHALPPTNATTDRQFAAWRALTELAPGDKPSTVWQEYQDVWTDDLTALGKSFVQLRNK